MSALELIELLESKELISDRRVEKIRRQVNESSKTITAGALAKLLVKKGLLTESQARKLLKQLEAKRAQPHLSDDLQLLPDNEIAPETELIEVDEPVPGDEEDLQPIDEDEEVPVVEPIEDVQEAEPIEDEAPLFDGQSVMPMDDILSDGSQSDEAASVTVGKKKSGLRAMLNLPAKGQRRKFTANRWDSPLLLVGGGGLLLLIFLAVGLWFYLSRGTGDDAFALADDDYRQQSYGQAISKFERFIAGYPDHPKVSLAKVRIGLAKMWSDVDRERWASAQETAREELAKIEGEEAFPEARPELATILPDIMDGFANQALAAEDVQGAQEALDLANDAYNDVNNAAYLPTSVRQGQQQRIEQILAKLEAVKHRINQDKELTRTVVDIQAAADQGEIAQAYDLRKTLLTKYPSLEADDRLNEVILTVTQKERESVGEITSAPTLATDDHEAASQYAVTLANRRGETAPGVAGRVVFAAIQGAVYGLKADTGEVIWRRYVGIQNAFAPQPLSNNPNADVLVVDSVRNEVLRLKADTGDLMWRLTGEYPVRRPVIAAGRLFVGFGDDVMGTLVEVDPESGEVLGGVELATGLAAGPALDDQRNIVAQVGSHSSIYLLDGEQWDCLGVHYLGHAEGTVIVPPVVLQEHVVVAENPGPDFSLIHILAPDAENPGAMRPLVDPIRFQGRVVVDMYPFGRRLLVSTDRGRIYVLELDPSNATEPVRQIADVTSTVEPGTIGFPLLDQGRLWVGDSQLSKYELQTSRGQLVRKWINSKGDSFLAPLRRIGDILYTVRKPANRAGASVSAVRIDERDGGRRDGQPIWNTDLGVPPAGEPFINRAAQEVDVVSANAALFALNTAAIRAGVVDKPKAEALGNQLPLLRDSLAIAGDEIAFFGRPVTPQLVLFQPGRSQSLAVVNLDLQSATPSTLPVSFQDGLLVGTSEGPVYLLDAKTGKAKVHPFQPPLQPGMTIDWLVPAAGDDGSAVIADKTGRAFRLSISDGDRPQLVASTQVSTEKKLIGRLAALGDSVFAAARDVGADMVVSWNAADLQPQSEWQLDGRVATGPTRIGNGVLVTTDNNEMIRWSGQAEPDWKIPMPYGPLAGEPLTVGQDLICASISGMIWKVDGGTGQETAQLDVGEPLGTGPIQFAGSRLLVCGGDGTVHIVGFPANE